MMELMKDMIDEPQSASHLFISYATEDRLRSIRRCLITSTHLLLACLEKARIRIQVSIDLEERRLA
jgi:hypothetical protein